MFLNQVSPSDPVSRAGYVGFFDRCPFLKDAQFFPSEGSTSLVKIAREGEAVSDQFRLINTNKTGTPPEPTYTPFVKKIVSWQSTVDKILEQRNEDIATELETQSILDGMKNGQMFQYNAFKADSAVNAKGFDGIVNLVDEDWNLSLEDAPWNKADGLIVPLGNSDANMTKQQEFKEIIEWLISIVEGGASHLYMPETLKTRMVSVAKALDYYTGSIDEWGKPIDMIGDVIIRGAGRDSTRGEILTFDEEVGASTKCASIIALRWGKLPKTDFTYSTSKGLVGEYAGLSGKQYVNEFDMDVVPVVQNKTSIVKLKGFRLV